MRNLFSLSTVSIYVILTSCALTNPASIQKRMQNPKTTAELSSGYGYEPIDPLPVSTNMSAAQRSQPDFLNSFPDETMRLAIGELNTSGGITYGTGKVGYQGHSYIVVLDYIKFDTRALKFGAVVKPRSYTYLRHPENPNDTATAIYTYDDTTYVSLADDHGNADLIIPAYIGVGLRLTANISVTKGEVNLGNLLLIGAAASADLVKGTLVVQTLGISGRNVTPLLPMPTDINSSSVQTAIVALGSIKAKIYEEGTLIQPRVVGFYNTLGSSNKTSRTVITALLAKPLSMSTENGEAKFNSR